MTLNTFPHFVIIIWFVLFLWKLSAMKYIQLLSILSSNPSSTHPSKTHSHHRTEQLLTLVSYQPSTSWWSWPGQICWTLLDFHRRMNMFLLLTSSKKWWPQKRLYDKRHRALPPFITVRKYAGIARYYLKVIHSLGEEKLDTLDPWCKTSVKFSSSKLEWARKICNKRIPL